jgi:hypothetical protein
VEFLLVSAVLVMALGGLIGAALFFGGRMEETAPTEPETSPRTLGVAAWVNAYLQTDEARAVMWQQGRRFVGIDFAQEMANFPRLPDQFRFEPMTVQTVPGEVRPHPDGGYWVTPRQRVYPLRLTERAQRAADAVETGQAPLEDLEGMTNGTIPIPPHPVARPIDDDVRRIVDILQGDRPADARLIPTPGVYDDQVNVYRYAIEAGQHTPNPMTEGPPNAGHDRALAEQYLGRAMGQRLHETLIDALENGPTTDYHAGLCGRANCTAPQCRPAPEPLTAERIGQMYMDGLMTFRQYRAMFMQDWAPTPEEQARHAAELERKAEAKQRAEGLLAEKLTPEQQQTWQDELYVQMVGGKTGHTYRIRGSSYSMNVDCRECYATYCAYPGNANETPIADVILAQMLWLQCDEGGFLAKALKHSLQRDYPDWSRRGGVVVDGVMWYDAPEYIVAHDAAGDTVLRWQHDPAPQTQPRPGRENVEAWMPDCCVERGCELRIAAMSTRTNSDRVVFHNGREGIRLHGDRSSREIRRLLERELHR